MKSKNVGLAQEAEIEQEDKYFDHLEKKDSMEEKMLNTKQIEAKVVSCSACGYTAYKQSDLCRSEGHQPKVLKVQKKFFECVNCKNRVTSFSKYPKEACRNCGGSSFKRAGMIREKAGPKLESERLCVRGMEQKFVGAAVKSGDLNLNL